MPVEIVRAIRIEQHPDLNGRDFTVFVITTEDADHRLGSRVTTINPWKASLCQQSLNQRRFMRIEWRDFRRGGKDLVTVELLGSVDAVKVSA